MDNFLETFTIYSEVAVADVNCVDSLAAMCCPFHWIRRCVPIDAVNSYCSRLAVLSSLAVSWLLINRRLIEWLQPVGPLAVKAVAATSNYTANNAISDLSIVVCTAPVSFVDYCQFLGKQMLQNRWACRGHLHYLNILIRCDWIARIRDVHHQNDLNADDDFAYAIIILRDGFNQMQKLMKSKSIPLQLDWFRWDLCGLLLHLCFVIILCIMIVARVWRTMLIQHSAWT